MTRTLSLALVLLTTTALSPVYAQDLNVDSTITDVTVYLDGADVVRRAEVSLPAGSGTLVLDDLTVGLSQQSLRVEALGDSELELGGIDLGTIALESGGLGASERARLEAEIERRQDARAVLADEVSAAELQKSYLESLAGVPPWMRADGITVHEAETTPDPEQVFAFIGRQIAPLLETIRDARIQQRILDREIADLKRQLDAEPSETLYQTEVGIAYSAGSEFNGMIEVRYRVDAARWTPFYDVRLETGSEAGGASVDLVRRAEIVQQTGEDWTDVHMTLATARPGGATDAPEPSTLYVDIEPPMPEPSAIRTYDEAESVVAAPMVDQMLSRESGADLVDTGFDALYEIAGEVTVAPNGEPRTVLIRQDVVPTAISVRTVPAIDPAAYLSAIITLDDGGVVIPGDATLYRNGVLVGTSYLDLIVPGDDAVIGFGVDDLVTVERIPVQDQRGERGLFGGSATDLKDWTIRISNQHDVSVDVLVLDRLPQSRDERIEIVALDSNTEATATDFDDTLGLLAWEQTVVAGGVMDVRFGYEVRWPDGSEISYRDW